MRIREGDPLEIYTDREGEVIFKKYSPMGELSSFAAQYAEAIYKACELPVAVCDRDAVITCAGLPRREFQDKTLSSEAEKILQGRSLYRYAEGEKKLPLTDLPSEYYITTAMPILTEGDVTGCVMALSKDDTLRASGEWEGKLLQTAAGFLGKQLES